MRLIDADALERHVYTEWANGELSNSEWIDLRQWLKDEPTVEPASPRWHRAEDGLPKDYGDYLGYADGGVMFLLFNPDTTDKWKWSACDAEGCFDVSVDEVTHWMPLPEPPKEE